MALLRIPNPNDPPITLDLSFVDDERIRVLITTVNMLIKRVDELEEVVRNLGK